MQHLLSLSLYSHKRTLERRIITEEEREKRKKKKERISRRIDFAYSPCSTFIIFLYVISSRMVIILSNIILYRYTIF